MASVRIEKAVLRLEKDPVFSRDRSIMVVVFGIRLLAMGIEMSVILPSVWYYIQPMGATPLFMGMVESAYAVGSMIAFPIVGLLYDRTKQSKIIILALNALQVFGNLLYAVPASKWCPLFGRFLAGLGDSFAACYLGELTYCFSARKRIGIISIIGSGRILGFMIGPALNFAIERASFRIGIWQLDSRNFAGFMMAIIWCTYQVVCAFSTLGLALRVIEEAGELEAGAKEAGELEAEAEEAGELEAEAEESSINEKANLVRVDENTPAADGSAPRAKYVDVLRELCSVEYLVLFLVDCVLWVPQQAYNILFPLITEKEYRWSASLSGSLYLAGSVEIVIIMLSVFFLGHRYPVRDTVVLRISVLFMGCSVLGLTLESAFKPYPARVAMLMICLTFVTASASLSMIASKAIITKTIKPEWQGMAHGTYSSVIRLAFICGPVVGGSAYHNRKIYGSVMIACIALGFVLLELVKGRFHRRQDILEHDCKQ